MEVGVGYSALFLVELVGSLRLGMLFVKVSVGLCGPGLCVVCSCMVGNTARVEILVRRFI
jgi:hypothetical protein